MIKLARTRIALPYFVPLIPWVIDGRTLRINPGEEARRSAPLPVFPLGARAVTACTLNQSSILIERIR
jgi:hypothetical protein